MLVAGKVALLRPFLFAVLFLPLFLTAPSVQADQGTPPRILVLNSYHSGYSWSDAIMKGIRQGFAASGTEVKLHIEYLDSKRHPPEALFPHLKELLRAKTRGHHFDLIFTTDNSALDFLLAVRRELFPVQPAVFCGVNSFESSLIANEANITGVVEEHFWGDTVDLACRLHPKRKTLVAVSDSTLSGKKNLDSFREAITAHHQEATTIELTGLSAAELAQALRRVPPQQSILFHLDFYRDREGRFLSIEESFNLIRSNTRLPIYVNTDNKMGFGALGGVVTSGLLQGEAAAAVAARILAGESADAIPVQLSSPKVAVFEYPVMVEFGVRPRDLPPGSIILNEPQPVFHVYRRELLLAGTVFILLCTATVLLAWNTVRRRQSEQRLRLFRELMDNANDAIFIVEPATGRFADVNARAVQTYGYSEQELLQLGVTDLNPSFPDAASWSLFSDEIRQKQKTMLTAQHRRKDGSLFPVEVNIRFHTSPAGEFFIAAARDVSERHQAAEKERQRMEQLAALNALASTVTASLSPGEVAKDVLREMVFFTEADFAILYILREGALVPIETHSRATVKRQEEAEPHRVGLCLCGLAGKGKPVYSENIHADPRCTLRECKEAGLYSFAALPLLKGEAVIGVLGIASLAKQRYSDQADFLEAMASQAAMGLQNALLHDQLKERAAGQEQLVRERTAELERRGEELEERNRELERLNRLFVDREFRIKELKEEVAAFQRKTEGL